MQGNIAGPFRRPLHRQVVVGADRIAARHRNPGGTDSIGRAGPGSSPVNGLVQDSEFALVVIARDLRPDLAARALAHGAASCISIDSEGGQVLDLIRSAATGDPGDEDAAENAYAVLGLRRTPRTGKSTFSRASPKG